MKKISSYRMLFRDFRNSPAMVDPGLCQMYIYLLLSTTWKDKAVKNINNVYALKTGQSIFGKYVVSQKLGISASSARRHLIKLEKAGMISRQPYSDCTVVTIQNFNRIIECDDKGRVSVSDGWICLHCNLVDTDIIKKPELLQVYICAYLQASVFGSDDEDLKRGEIESYEQRIRDCIGISETDLLRCISRLELDGLVYLRKTDYHGCVLGITKWNLEQIHPSKQYVAGDLLYAGIDFHAPERDENIILLRERII